ncbi:unnamed protein product [Sphenostylis stenocarpa]|uniref:Transcription factor Iwr1 domain-containing protein n=1 Tax=Sphenostylis stenocarpa TaxID=92480 RepID=A0AA86RYG1_9FABA|nr:unnamed protein product [Sphenostylis stenocarpa]
MAESSLAAPPPPKPVVVRVKRKPSQSPLDAFWLEINERPLKRSLLDFGNLSISGSAQKVEFHNKKVFVQHVETISSSEVTFDIVQSFVDPGSSCASNSKPKLEERKNLFKRDNKQNQLLVKARQEKETIYESLAKDARFEQIWKSRKGNKGTAHDTALQEICNFYDIVRVDNEEKNKEVQQQEFSLEDQRLLSSYLPLLREFIPNAAAEVEADLIVQLVGHPREEKYVYDLYTVTDEIDINTDDTSASYPLVQVEEEEDYYDGPDDDSDYESDDSNAENNPLNDYPEEISEEDEEVEDSKNELEIEYSDTSNETSGEDIEYHGFSKDDADQYDEDLDEYEGVGNCDEDVDDEDWRWSYR